MGNELANKTAKNVINIYFWYIFFCFAAAVAAAIVVVVFVVVFFIFGYIFVSLNGRVFPSIFGVFSFFVWCPTLSFSVGCIVSAVVSKICVTNT